jgi:acetyl-CoA carboxylase biotin carboxylase subunit
MAEVALTAARAVDYVGAGTIEFLIDDQQNFYFLEMNTRLQVEHPVTELVTGIDMVQAQIRVAAGEPLPFTQADVQPRGAAIECRIYAEDPHNGFSPSPGPIHHMREPGGPWVRIDGGAYAGWEVPIHYDSLIAKLAVWGRSREEAIHRMKRALEEYSIRPIRTTIPFHLQVMDNAAFRAGEYTTGFIAQQFGSQAAPEGAHREVAAVAAAIATHLKEKQAAVAALSGGGESGRSVPSPWRLAGRLRGINRS